MRLSDVLSKPITTDYVQIEGFLSSRKLKTGNSKKNCRWQSCFKLLLQQLLAIKINPEVALYKYVFYCVCNQSICF